MSDMITRCPSCATSFRITDTQLKTANGAVRCGSCLHIFKALDHVVKSKDGTPPKAAPKPAAPAPKPEVKKPAAASKPAASLTTKFEYKRPASTAPAGSAKAAPRPGSAHAAASKPHPKLEEDSDELDSVAESAAMAQENLLSFDQKLIDEEELNTASDEDDLLISDDMEDDEEVPKSKQAYGDDLSESFLDLDTSAWRPQEKSLFDREIKSKDDDDEKDNSDESWAVSLLEEMDEDQGDGFVQPPEPDSEDDYPEESYSRATTGTFTALDDDDIEDALGEPLSERESNDEVFEYRDRRTGEEEALDYDHDGSEKYGSGKYRSDQQPALEDDYFEDESDYSEPKDRAALIRRIEPEPLEMDARHYMNWRKKLIYIGIVSVGALVLIMQVAWLQYSTLSHDPTFRKWYSFFGIEVPSMRDKNRIRASNLIVRTHPEASNALMVDTILHNTAPFEQPFPDLVLSFTNLQGEVLAARTFAPKEYLNGELAGKTQMPSGQPIHLSLEIVDPGPEAVNYTAYIP